MIVRRWGDGLRKRSSLWAVRSWSSRCPLLLCRSRAAAAWAAVRENRQRRTDRQGRRVIIRPPIERAIKAARSLWSLCRHVRSSAPAYPPQGPRARGAQERQERCAAKRANTRLLPPVCAHLRPRSICSGSGGHRAHALGLGLIEIVRPPLHHRPTMSEIARRIVGGPHAARLMGKLVLDPVGLE